MASDLSTIVENLILKSFYNEIISTLKTIILIAKVEIPSTIIIIIIQLIIIVIAKVTVKAKVNLRSK